MTVLAKPSIAIKKPDDIKAPLVDEDKCVCNEDKVTIYPSAPPPRSKHSGALFCLTLIAFIAALSGALGGLMVYRQYLITNTPRHYQRFCAIPIDDNKEPDPEAEQLVERLPREHRVVPLQWSQEPIRVVASSSDDDAVRSLLREEFDIGDRVEHIRVKDNGRTISFIHDFDENTTGIVDPERCFLMDLDPESVLQPDVLMVGIAEGGQFDVSHVRTTLRAALPALVLHARMMAARARMIAEHCAEKPLYMLQKEEGVIIRKRSVDAPPHDYIQFSGKHIQEIEISNLAEILDYEKHGA